MTTLGVKITHGVGLQSKGATKGGRPRPSQPGHWDYCQDTIRRHHVVQHQKRIQQTWPWTVLISLQPEGLLWVFSAGVWKLLSLREGDAVLVRGDVWHAGAGYVKEHWRVHFYCEPIHAEDPTLQFRADDEGSSHCMGCCGMWARMQYGQERMPAAPRLQLTCTPVKCTRLVHCHPCLV